MIQLKNRERKKNSMMQAFRIAAGGLIRRIVFKSTRVLLSFQVQAYFLRKFYSPDIFPFNPYHAPYHDLAADPNTDMILRDPDI